MLKALIKKQFSEYFAAYFVDRKTGKARDAKGIAMYMGIFVFALLSIGYMFFNISSQLAGPLYMQGLSWLYYSIMALMGIAIGVFGSVFNTYASLYNAKDNDLLLSMPIPAGYVLASRLLGAYTLGTIYEGVVFMPAIIADPGIRDRGAAGIILPLLLLFIIGFVVLTLTCLLGWLVALAATRVKNRNIVSVIISVILLGGYYYLWINLQKYVTLIINRADSISDALLRKAMPVYALGMGAAGDIKQFALFTVFAFIMLALTLTVMSLTFLKMVTRNRGSAKGVYKNRAAKQRSVKSALLRKELSRFLGSANYMLNGGFGLIVMIAASVILIIKPDFISKAFENAPQAVGAMPSVFACLICMMCGMNPISSPSVSLEGKNVWIPKSLPVRAYDILTAKARLQFVLNILPAEILAAVSATVLGADLLTALFMCTAVFAFNSFFGRLGVMVNLYKPVMTWTNEVIPIKQSMSVFLGIMSGMVICALSGIAGFALSSLVPQAIILAVLTAVYALAAFALDKAFKGKGTQLFETL